MVKGINGVNNSGQAVFNVSKSENTFTNSIFTGNSTQQTKKDALQIDMEKRQKAHKKAQAKVNNALARAKQNIGVVETTPNDSIKIRDFRMGESANKKTPVKSTAPYCASFVSYCYGNDTSAFGYESYTPSLRNKAQKAGCYVNKSKIGTGQNGTYKPQSGDLLMWINKNGKGGHVGIIESCKVANGKMYITTIEGNTVAKGEAETATTKATGGGPEGVMRKTYTLDELKQNGRVNGVVQMTKWLENSAYNSMM